MEGTERRWAWSEVDLDAVSRNVARLRATTGSTVMFMAVVKADGYGHGAVEVAKAAVAAGADRLGVATVDEAMELRCGGLDVPVHLFSEAPSVAAGLLVENDVVATVFSRQGAEALSAAAAACGRVGRFHLKIDSGMGRIGVRAEDAADFVESLRGLPFIAMEGVFTHFASADVPGDWEFERQLERFGSAVDGFRRRGIDPGIVHSANTAATILHPRTHFDMVRCGIGIYGLHPATSTIGQVELEPAMAVKARVSRVARLGMGEGVSYGLTWHAAAPVTIATLPIGYADGVRRSLSNRMEVFLGGRVCQQVGRICMDQLMVEVPRDIEVSAGDTAVIVGPQSEAVTLDRQAGLCDTINYEIACGYGARLHRRYCSSRRGTN